MISKFFEYNSPVEDSDPIKSFYLKDTLNPKVWTGNRIDHEIRNELSIIAEDYFENLEIGSKLLDIVLTGSLSNYNWSNYSDFDLHLIFDFSRINDDEELVRKFLTASEKVWKYQHDIKIGGYEVEIYCQDVKEKHVSSGKYSIMNNKWLVRPNKENFVPDEDLIRVKSQRIMDDIDDLKVDLDEDVEYDIINSKLKKTWKKIKENRKAGLEKDGEFSIENLVFKLLRRNGYIEKILTIKRRAYDKQFK